MNKIFTLVVALFISLTPSLSLTCACGCSLFDIGTSSLIANQKGGLAFLQYDYLNQNKNPHNSLDEEEMTSSTSRNSIGDVKLTGVYSSFFSDMSTRLIFGAKLPSEATKQNGFEHEMQIGTKNYDATLGYKF